MSCKSLEYCSFSLFLERAQPTELGEEDHPQRGHGDRSDPADQHGRHGTEERGGQARLEGAELVRGAGEQRVHGAHKGPDARRRPPAAREAYSLYGERAAKGADCRASEGSARPSDSLTYDDHADGPFSAACYRTAMASTSIR